MQQFAHRPIAAALMRRAGGPSAGSGEVAQAVAAVWEHIELVLQPILGKQGVAALYARIMKMRGQPTLPGLHSFRIGPAGLDAFPPAGRVMSLPPELAATPIVRLSTSARTARPS